TDSGGIQEETTYLGVPCFTLRATTERPITISHGTNVLLGLDPERILEVPSPLAPGSGRELVPPPGWDGHAAERVVDVIANVLPRVFFYPRGAPNSIATSFAGLALVDAFERTRDEALLDRAAGAARFFLAHVPQTPSGRGAFFGYLVGDRTPIHNANLLVCALLARVHAHAGDERLRRAAEAGVAYSVGLQRDDGSWPYAERPGLQWVDGYHTGYVLDSLIACHE